MLHPSGAGGKEEAVLHLQAVRVLRSDCDGFCVARGHLTAVQRPQPDSHLHHGDT